MSVERDPRNVYCYVHQLYHINEYSNIYLTNVANNISFLKFQYGSEYNFGSVRCSVQVYSSKSSKYLNGFVIQMSIPCEYGLTSDSGYNLDCTDKRGIIFIGSDPQTCFGTKVHVSLCLRSDGRLQLKSICCMNTSASLNKFPTMKIGNLFFWKNEKVKDTIMCKWMGLINNVECVAGEMKSWCEYGSNGTYGGVNVFSCIEGRGIILRVEDIEFKLPRNDIIIINENGFINIESTIRISESEDNDLLSVGCRVKLLHNKMNRYTETKTLYGEIKWMGHIDRATCAGVELDYPCDGSKSGTICGDVAFECKPGHGVLLIIEDVELDVESYLPSFTVAEDYKEVLNNNSQDETLEDEPFKENWNHDFLKREDIQEGSDIFIRIEKKGRTIEKRAKLVWFGSYYSLTLAIVELKFIPGLKYNAEIQSLIPSYLQDKTKLHLPINPDYIFKYGRSQTTTLSNEGNNNLGSLKFSQKDIENAYQEGVKYALDVIKPDKDMYNSLLGDALKSNKKLLKCLIERDADCIDIVKYPSILDELKRLQLDDVINQLTTNCVIDDASDEQLLRLAKVALKNDYSALFHRVIDKCTDRDMIMSDGETFLTGIIKDHLIAKAITMALDTNKFSATKSNDKSETPMMLVCSNMMVDIVETLLLAIKNQSMQTVICSICLDKNVRIVFGCGHNCCKECSDNIDYCHMCSNEITQRGPIFFNN